MMKHPGLKAMLFFLLGWTGVLIFPLPLPAENNAQKNDENLSTTTPAQHKFLLEKGDILSNLISIAVQNNAGLQASLRRIEAEYEKADQATGIPDPKIGFSQFIQEIETRVGPQQRKYDISQTLPWPSKLKFKQRISLADAEAAEYEYQALLNDLVYDVTAVYYEIYYVGKAITVYTENLELMKMFERVAGSRYRVGGSTQTDVLRAQIERDRLDEMIRTLNDTKDALTGKLNALLNRPLDDSVRVAAKLPGSAPLPAFDQIFTKAKQQNPGLKRMESAAAALDAATQLQGVRQYPDFTFGLSYIETDEAVMPVDDSGKDPFAASVSFNIPLWRKKYDSAVRETQKRRQAVLSELQEKEHRLSAMLYETYLKLMESERRMKLYNENFIPRAKLSLEEIQAAFIAGSADFMDIIEAQRNLLDFQLTRERAAVDYAKNAAELEMLVGKMPQAAKKQGVIPESIPQKGAEQ